MDALGSVARQTFSDYELVIVNDGSSNDAEAKVANRHE
jgi:glycosyltransferase involved in cell wall biosynthesis